MVSTGWQFSKIDFRKGAEQEGGYVGPKAAGAAVVERD